MKNITIENALKGLRNKEFSSVELTKSYLDNIAAKNDSINAYITVTPELALEQAARADINIGNDTAGLVEGIPVAVKDLFCTNGVKTTAGSKMLESFVPRYESGVTRKMFGAGAVMLGKTNQDEFAMGSANTTSYFGAVKNPLDESRVAGGSSGGSAAAVAGDLAIASLGTDTGGSIRQPASFTGTVGIKPTYGRCSRWGTVAFASSLDQAGVFAKTVKDSALLLEAISGYDVADSTSVEKQVPQWFANIAESVKGKKIGIPKEYMADNMPQEISDLWARGAKFLEEQGATIVDISLPHTKYALPVYYVIAPAEASSNLARYDGVKYGHRTAEEVSSLDEMYNKTRAEGFGDEVKRRILVGTYVLSHGYYDAYYIKAQQVRSLIAQDFAKAFAQVDAILTPTAPSDAFKIGEKESDPVKMYLNDIFTVPASLAGLPAISIPAGLSSQGLPLGLQIIGNAFDEQAVFDVANSLEKMN